MKFLQRSLSFALLLCLFLSSVAFSVSAAAPTDWTNSPPYKEDFLAPAGEDSVVYEVFNDKGDKRLVVFPSGAVVAHFLEPGNTRMGFMWTGDGDPQPIFVYFPLGDGNYSPTYYATVPSSALNVPEGNSPAYLGGWNVYEWNVTGFITNQTFDNISNAPQGKKLAFHSKQAAADEKTQGMLSKLAADIKEWFSGLISNLKEGFTNLSNSIKGFFDGLALKIETFFKNLIEDIKALFIPQEGFFGEYAERFNVWAHERFGFIFETIDFTVDLITRLINITPSKSYTITIPTVSFKVFDTTVVLIEETTFSFNELLNSSEIFNFLHELYFVCMYGFYFFILLSLGRKSFTDIFGGGADE